jgi:peptidoglycan/LPS O-acetylase OafA/YrhL
VIAVAMLLLFPAGSFVMNTVGILVVALGYGGLLCLGLGMENRLGTIMRDGGWGAQVLRILASLGRHSYSIYLWHLLVDNLLMKAGMYATLGWEYGGTAAGLITIVFAILLGISMGTLIELPVLRWRNRVIT